MIKKSATSILLCLLISVSLNGQVDYTWWNEINNWDGITPWDQYIIKSPGFMGPNALPVPEMKTGRLPDKASIRLFTDLHYSNGDNTQDDPEAGHADRDFGKKVAGLCAERALASHAAESPRQTTALAALDQHQHDQKNRRD